MDYWRGAKGMLAPLSNYCGGPDPPPPPLPTPVSMECSILLKGDSVKSFAPLLDGVKVSCNKGHKIVAKPKRPVYRESFNKFDIYV